MPMALNTLFQSLADATYLAVEVLAILISLATLITSLLPSRSDNISVDTVLQILNLLAGNVGHNRNADDR